MPPNFLDEWNYVTNKVKWVTEIFEHHGYKKLNNHCKIYSQKIIALSDRKFGIIFRFSCLCYLKWVKSFFRIFCSWTHFWLFFDKIGYWVVLSCYWVDWQYQPYFLTLRKRKPNHSKTLKKFNRYFSRTNFFKNYTDNIISSRRWQ